MTGHKHEHFRGKDALHHVIEARRKGKIASDEIHGEEISGHYSAAGSSGKQTALLFILILSIFQDQTLLEPKLLVAFLSGWLIWKTGNSAILGWRRLERLHRVIEEERWEIEHHRSQEKEELTALYAAKGFSGKQLEEVIEVLMADDNRLLQVMLEEELGLNLESYEHPLKQAVGAALGVISASSILLFGLFNLPLWGSFFCAGAILATASGLTAYLEQNQPLSAVIWNLAVAALAGGCAHFMAQLLIFAPST